MPLRSAFRVATRRKGRGCYRIGISGTLSEYGFFNGRADGPSSQLIAYRLRTPLFSGYAEKQRFLYLPADSRLKVDREGRIEFPVGTALIKSFGYPAARAN
ncbi:MAG: hypothetical protein IPL18_14050 [Sphingomonadales bacterium]|nr:hypothetical protein [Sphingomonadales bacterium]